jgi:hypothetical protein
MSRYIPLQDEPSYVKDSASSALINNDANMLAEYKARRKTSKQIKDMQAEINMLKDELHKIKSHLNLR